MSKRIIKRGEIYWVKLDPTFGSEINKVRPCLVISNNRQNEFSPLVIVIPITSDLDKIYPFELMVELGSGKGKILTDQVRSLDKERLGNKISELDEETMTQISEKMKRVMALEKQYE
ncbi:MAG: Endoribonuclease EndoA [Mycoplasmataceae bacterium]|nr:MAG: Endoribonuclease EndoA [Mycoplasmataceae bacterium]